MGAHYFKFINSFYFLIPGKTGVSHHMVFSDTLMLLVYIQYIVLEISSILKYTYTTENNTIIKITAWTKEEWDEIQMC